MKNLQLVRECIRRMRKDGSAVVVHIGNYDGGKIFYSREYVIAPNPPLYTSSELNQFMLGIVPEVPRSAIEFRDYNHHMSFGRLIFSELVGDVAKISADLHDEEPEAMKKFVSNLHGRIDVQVCPDENVARDAISGKLKGFSASAKDLEEYRKRISI